MLSLVEIESMRRSAAMSPLSLDDHRKLLAACADMARERERIATTLAKPPRPDSEILDRALWLTELRGQPVWVATGDTAMALRARASGLTVAKGDLSNGPHDTAVTQDARNLCESVRTGERRNRM